MRIHTHGAFTLLSFWLAFWNFLRISNRQNQSVVNALYYVYPTHPLCKGQSIGVGQYKNRNLYWFFKFILPILCYTILQKIHFYLYLSPQIYRAIVPKRGTRGSFFLRTHGPTWMVRRWFGEAVRRFYDFAIQQQVTSSGTALHFYHFYVPLHHVTSYNRRTTSD